jgi:hypothetical protein
MIIYPMFMTARAAAAPLNNYSKTHQTSSMKIGAGRSRAVLVAMLTFCYSKQKRAPYLSASIKCLGASSDLQPGFQPG